MIHANLWPLAALHVVYVALHVVYVFVLQV
jgi:hypothetical protein